MNVCMCGSQDGYPHDASCPYPLFRGSDKQCAAWEQAQAVEHCATELAMNFDVPAKQIIGCYAAKLGVSESNLRKLLEARVTES